MNGTDPFVTWHDKTVNETPHVAFEPGNEITYATRAGAVWTTEALPLLARGSTGREARAHPALMG